MPLSINVGLSRKASRDYQSTGVSINVTAELDQSLLAKPGELQRQIDELYGQAEQAIERQVKAYAGQAALQPLQTTARPNTNGNQYRRNWNGSGNGSANGNGNGAGNGRSRSSSNGNGNGAGHNGGMTESQRRAITAIAQRVEADPGYEAHDLFGVALDELTIKQASELIDHLKLIALPGAKTATATAGTEASTVRFIYLALSQFPHT